MDTVSRDRAAVLVHDRSLAVAARLGVPLSHQTRLPAACTDPDGNLSQTGVYYMSARQQLIVGEDRMAETVRTAHSHFRELGFEVAEIRWLPDGSGAGMLDAADPDGFRYSLTPATPRVGYAFSVYSPCYQAPEGEDPIDGRWQAPPEATRSGAAR